MSEDYNVGKIQLVLEPDEWNLVAERELEYTVLATTARHVNNLGQRQIVASVDHEVINLVRNAKGNGEVDGFVRALTCYSS